MKKGGAFVMVMITLLFAAFTAGVLVGKNVRNDNIVISTHIPAATQDKAAEAFPPENQGTAAATPSALPPVSGKLNINTATAEQLETLPGIGPALAQRIADYIETYGPLTCIEELTDVTGIGEKKLSAIADMITTEDGT